jgi:hypothetical protein
MMTETKTSKPPKPALSLSAMFQQGREDAADDFDVAGLPPSLALPTRSKRTLPVPDLTGFGKVWELIGPGGAGKTVLARWLGGGLTERGMDDQAILAALDPANRTLTHFFDKVQQPPSSDPVQTTAWLRGLLGFVAKQKANAVLDYGGNNVSKVRLVEAAPTIADSMEQDGVALVAAYVLTPRVDDLASLVTFEARGFRPRATALILNLGRAETPAAFDALRRQSAYKAALDRGAVELWMPALEPQSLALQIEQQRLQFHQARDGDVPAGRNASYISALERVMIREWMTRMDEEFATINTWLPWATS